MRGKMEEWSCLQQLNLLNVVNQVYARLVNVDQVNTNWDITAGRVWLRDIHRAY